MLPSRRIITMGGDKFRDEHSLAFDGSDDYVDLGSQSNAGDDITVSAWVKLAVDQAAPIITLGKMTFRLHNSTSVKFWADVSGSNTTTTIPDCLNKWVHLAVSSDAGVNNVYANGVLFETETDNTLSNTASDSYIGRYSSIYFEGNISEVAVYNSVLTSSQIKTIYNDREPYNHKEGIASGNLHGWWRMGDGNLDVYPVITDLVTTTKSSELSPNSTFDTNASGWESKDEGVNTLSRDTSIKYSGSGSLKIVFGDSNSGWGATTSNNLANVSANKLLVMEAKVYIPSSSYNGGHVFLTDGGSYGSAFAENTTNALNSVTDEWQSTKMVTRLSTDATGRCYVYTSGADPSENDILYFDEIKIYQIDGMPGIMTNMTVSDIEKDVP